MFRHSILLIYRNFLGYKGIFAINLIGLSAGLACALVIYLWISDELSVDKYHQNDSRLYQVMFHAQDEKGIDTRKDTPHSLADGLATDFPEVELSATATPELFLPAFTLTANGENVKGTGKFVGRDFFRIFSYNLVRGDDSDVLADRNSVVLSESQAERIFGSTDVVGKTVTWDVAGLTGECTVTGIFKDVPVKSSEQFDFILSFEALKEIMGMQPNWSPEPFYTYISVKKGTDISRLNGKITAYVKDKSKDNSRSFFLKPFSDNYLYSKYENGKEAGGRIDYVKLFSFIALFIIVISCINFMNLSTARAIRRIKEIGIKKAIGAGRRVLAAQYLGESILMTLLCAVIAILLVWLLLPHFNELTGKDLNLSFERGTSLILLLTILFTSLVAGSYSAIYLSGFKPSEVLKGRFNSTVEEVLTRKGLVVFQFTISIIFIASVLVLYKQIDYIQHKNLGLDKENILYFEPDGKIARDQEAFLHEIKKLHGIEMASSMVGHLISDKHGSRGAIVWDGKEIPAQSFGINYEMIETLGIKMKEGRSFSREFTSDNRQIILNEAAVEAMGIRNPVATIIKGESYDTEIIGVINNFHFQSLHERISPMKFRLDNGGPSTILVRLKAGEENAAILSLTKLYKDFNPGSAFDYKFLDQDYQALYVSERQVSLVLRYFAGIAIVISCLGLLGLAAFTAERRKKEIGIRKVMGASEQSIIYLLTSEFSRLVVIAIFIALPVSWFASKLWLDNFAYRIDLQWWYFIVPGLAALLIAWLTVSIQAARAAGINPVLTLNDE